MQITCERCNQPVEVTEEESSWKTMCKKCFAIMKKEEQEKEPKQKGVGEFKRASVVSVEEDVALMVKIAKQLAFDLGKKVEELNEAESKWVSTIYIQKQKQKRRNGL